MTFESQTEMFLNVISLYNTAYPVHWCSSRNSKFMLYLFILTGLCLSPLSFTLHLIQYLHQWQKSGNVTFGIKLFFKCGAILLNNMMWIGVTRVAVGEVNYPPHLSGSPTLSGWPHYLLLAHLGGQLILGASQSRAFVARMPKLRRRVPLGTLCKWKQHLLSLTLPVLWNRMTENRYFFWLLL